MSTYKRSFYIVIKEHIREKIIKNVILIDEINCSDLTWKKQDAINLINELKDDEIGILGGDVYKLEPNKLIPLYDNWYCEPHEAETIEEYYSISKKKSIRLH